jgi:hypothetical protein
MRHKPIVLSFGMPRNGQISCFGKSGARIFELPDQARGVQQEAVAWFRSGTGVEKIKL